MALRIMKMNGGETSISIEPAVCHLSMHNSPESPIYSDFTSPYFLTTSKGE